MDPLEQRVVELEKKLEKYERIFSVTASQLIIHQPIVVKGTIGVGGPAGSSSNKGAMIIVGPGIPTIAAPKGSIYMRSDGATGTSVYGSHNDAGGWHAL